jgi:hypothetical protein
MTAAGQYPQQEPAARAEATSRAGAPPARRLQRTAAVSSATRESRRTAFNAAYMMGEHGRELFDWLAGEDLPAARQAAVFSLYLQWRRDRKYVFDLLDRLSRQVGLPPIWRRGRVLRFIGDLSITIYINHPDDEEVIKRTSALWRRVLRRQLHLNRLLFLLRAPILGHLQAIIAVRTLRTAILADVQDPEAFFRQGPEDRQRFLRTVPLVDPATEIGMEAQRDLARLLSSPLLPHRILAALVIAIHAVRDPEATASIVDKVRDQLPDGPGQLWATIAYSVPLSGTPDAWVGQLERMTEDLLERQRDTFFGRDTELLSRFDIGLVPLGLAYGKRGTGMPLFDRWLQDGLLGGGDRELAVRTIRGLGAVGVYFPHAVFESLRVCGDAFRSRDTYDPVVDALVASLAAMRTLHFDAVDLFLRQMRASDPIRDAVSARDGSDLVVHCVLWVGYYNNAVHQALNYPLMRKALVIDGLEELGRARRPAEFIRAYTLTVLRLLEETDFELMRWTRRDADDAEAAAPAMSDAAG